MIALVARRTRPEAVILALGCAALVAREPSWPAVGATAVVGLAALTVAVEAEARSPGRWLWVTALGAAAFAAVRASGGAVPAVPFGIAAAAANVVAGFAEEALFRRTAFAWLRPHGAAVAIGVTAALFALVHVPEYGWGVLPIDLAAGALLGWQREAAGSWTSPAVTHAAANLMQMG